MSRHYKHDGLILPSVTTILSDVSNSSAPLMQWSSNCCIEWVRDYADWVHPEDNYKLTGFFILPEQLDDARFAHKKISKQALAVGSEVHSAIKEWLTKVKQTPLPDSFSDDMVNEFNNAFSAFLKFEKDYKLEPIKTEHKLYGDGFAGTCDVIAKITIKGERKVFLLDYKTSKNLFRETRIQTAAYRSMTTCEGNGAVRLCKKTGLYGFKDYSKSYNSDLIEWYRSIELYFARHPIVKSKAFAKETV